MLNHTQTMPRQHHKTLDPIGWESRIFDASDIEVFVSSSSYGPDEFLKLRFGGTPTTWEELDLNTYRCSNGVETLLIVYSASPRGGPQAFPALLRPPAYEATQDAP